MVNEKVNYMSIGKEYVNNSDIFSYTQSAQLTNADIEMLKAKFGEDLVAVYTGEDTCFGYYDYAQYLKDRSKIQNTMGSSFYQPFFSGLVEITEAQLDKLGYTLEGKLPTADNEIAVTNYALDIFKLCGYNSTTNSTINGFSELRNKKIILNDRITDTQKEYVIVGVVDTKFNSSRYESMMPSSDNDSMDTGSTTSTQNSLGSLMLSQELTAVLQYSLHAAAFVNQGTLSELESVEKYRPNSGYVNVYFSDNQSNDYIGTSYSMNCSYLCPKKAIADGSYILFNGGTTLGDNDVLISPQSFANWCSCSGNDVLIDFASQIPEKRNSFYDYLINNEDVVWEYIDGGAPLVFDCFNKTNESGEYNFKLTFTQSETGSIKLEDVYHFDATGDYYLSGYDSNGMPIYNLLSTATLYSYNEETGTYFEDADGDYIRVDEVSYDLVSNNRYSKDKEYQQIYNYEDISADTVRYTFSYVKDTDGDYTLNLSEAQIALVDLLIGTGYESNPYGNSGKEIYAHIVKESLAAYSGAVPACPVYMHYSNYLENENTTTSMNIVGLYFGSDGDDVVLSDKKIESLALQVGGMYSCVVGALPTGDKLDELLEFWEDDGIESSNYTLNNSVTVALTGVGSYLESFTTVFLYIGLGCALFASFLLMTFISTSISYKKSEIGILRAVGARSADVVNIFFNEALIIALINFTVALIGTAIAVSSINTTLKATFNLALTLLNFGVLQALYMLLIAIGAAFLASSIPVFLTARKKPIDAIRSR
jgi:ABC-type transport system, involved in lipoprotein release, permease component